MDIIEKYTQIYGSPYLTGIFMGTNAIKDVALFVDGPDCVFYKADMLYKTHDLFSQIKQASIDTKLYFSGVMPNKMIRGYDEEIKNKLLFIEENPIFNLGFITCMPVTGLIANQYENIYKDLNKQFIFVPSYTDKFRLDGYSIFLRELAKNIKLNEGINKKKLNISIVGYLYDRNEGDCIGNIDEIKRIISLLGVEINSIWLNGGNLAELSKIEESELIVSLPYGTLASKVLAKRLGIETIELQVPFGLKNTIEFVKIIGNKLGISEEKINSILKNEIKFVKDKIDLLDEKIFLNKNYVYAGDQFLEGGIKDIGKYLGMNHIASFFYNGSKQANEKDFDIKPIDLVIGNSEFNIRTDTKFEFGFPSYNTHFLLERPYMGFRGIIYFIERLYKQINKIDKSN